MADSKTGLPVVRKPLRRHVVLVLLLFRGHRLPDPLRIPGQPGRDWRRADGHRGAGEAAGQARGGAPGWIHLCPLAGGVL